MFKRYKGKTKIMYFQKDTTEQIREGGLLTMNDSGQVTRAGNDSDDDIIGVACKNDTLADSALVPVEVPVESAVEWEIDLDSDGGAVDSDVGRYVSVDTAGGGSVNAGDSCAMRLDISDSSNAQVFVTGIISSTKVRGVIALSAFHIQYDT
jgi:hypothetical protein